MAKVCGFVKNEQNERNEQKREQVPENLELSKDLAWHVAMTLLDITTTINHLLIYAEFPPAIKPPTKK